MNRDDIRRMLEEVSGGRTSPEEALEQLSALPFADFGVAKHDGHRVLRNGFSEVILCEGKRVEHVVRIVGEAIERGLNVFGTRAGADLMATSRERFPEADVCDVSRTFRHVRRSPECIEGRLAVLAAGTADLAVAEEAVRTAQFFGVEPVRHYDVGVAGLHRLLSTLEGLKDVDAAIVVAGMEGALPSVVAGLIPSPIIAVPTSVGYGANFKGVAALLGMLNSCSEGVAVVNIDNGFGAACAAIRILRTKSTSPQH